MDKPLIAIFIVLALLLVNSAATAREADLIGDIVDVREGRTERNPFHLLSMHVKSAGNDRCGIIFSVDNKTKLYSGQGANRQEVGVEQLKTGVHVAVWFTNVFQSCPGKSYAEIIEIR